MQAKTLQTAYLPCMLAMAAWIQSLQDLLTRETKEVGLVMTIQIIHRNLQMNQEGSVQAASRDPDPGMARGADPIR